MMQTIPRTWRMVKLGLCLQRRKETVLSINLIEESVSLVGLEDIQDGGRGGITLRKTKPQEIQSLKTRFFAGDILYGKLRPYLNKVGIAPKDGFCSTEIWVFEPREFLDSRFATFFLASSFFVDRVSSLTKGANLPRLDTSDFDSIEIPLPPISEQQRIVEILQEAEEIRRLRTEAADKTAELISALFFNSFLKLTSNDYQPLSNVAEVVSGVALGRKMKGVTVEVPYIRVANVQAGFIDLTEIKTTIATEEEIGKFALKNGDILMTEGGDFDKLGRGCLWEGQIETCIHQNHVFRVRPDELMLNSHFFVHYLQSAIVKQYFLRCAKKTTNLASINLTQLKALPIPKISIEAQNQFELQIRAANECNAAIGNENFIALIRSLAANAFSGQLTDAWRSANRDSLGAEARERDAALNETGAVSFDVKPELDLEIAELLQDRTYGVYADLNRDQRLLLREIGRMVGGVPYARYFTAQKLSKYISESPLHDNPQVIEGHLTVLAARGLIIPVSREEKTEDTGEVVFGNTYRLPLEGFGPFDDQVGMHQTDDHARLREMERLALVLEKERSLI